MIQTLVIDVPGRTRTFFACSHQRWNPKSEDAAIRLIDAGSPASDAGETATAAAGSGMGRTRLLEELALQARMAGATVLFANASVTR
jgi:hypothetical protein